MEELRRRIAELEALVAALAAENRRLRRELEERDARIAQLEAELRRRGKPFTPKANAPPNPPKPDRRKNPHRRHGGVFRRPPEVDESQIIQHDVRQEACPHCGGASLVDTGEFDDHLQVDIPEPRYETHRYRRHVQTCRSCGRTSQGRGDLELPGAHLGPRVRLFNAFARAHLGLPSQKSNDLLAELFGLTLSRAGTLGHIRWTAKLCDPVVQKLWELLRASPTVHADETGWRINGRNVWAWCFCNARLALYLIEQSRSAAVVKQALGDSLPGVLVSDFYAAYNAVDAVKQKCLVHLLRELHRLSEKLPAAAQAGYIEPLRDLIQQALALAKERVQLPSPEFARRHQEIERRLDDLIFSRPRQRDCRRINKRLVRHRHELLTFLEKADVPADNNLAERDIRSLAAARSDGGVHRQAWSARAFAVIKSVIRTCRKNDRPFIDYTLSLLRAAARQHTLPLPIILDSS